MTFDAASEVEFKQDEGHLRGLQARVADDIIDQNGG